MNTDFKIVVTDDRFHGNYKPENDVLQEINAKVEVKNLSTEEETIDTLRNADAVLLNLYPLTACIIREMQRCRVISRYGIGYDNVDVKAATSKRIWVTRVPDYCREEVAEHALVLLLSCIRMIVYRDRSIRKGEWNLYIRQPTYRIGGKILGLIGYGASGRSLHRKVLGFGLARVLVYDPYVKIATIKKKGAIPVDFQTLLRESDYISIHTPLTEETRKMIGKKEMAQMKNTAIIVNTARGPVIDEAALVLALQKKELACAGLDVFEEEPLPDKSPLKSLENVILSDHCGWYSEESLLELKTKAAWNVLQVLKGKKPLYPVNMPDKVEL